MPDKQTSLKLACIVIVLFAAGFLLPKLIGIISGPPQSEPNPAIKPTQNALIDFMAQAKAEFDRQTAGENEETIFTRFNFRKISPEPTSKTFQPLRHWDAYLNGLPSFMPSVANRVKGAGSDQTDLIFILRGVKDDACKATGLETTGSIDLSAYPKLPGKASQTELPADKGCIKTTQGNYFYQLIKAR